jgi:predicted AlkP superfamily pyrophosphatase or phosphodiesterase
MTSMLPAIPSAFGNLKDVFRSAQNSVLGQENAFALPKASSAIVVMVDGLGAKNLEASQRYAPFLSSASQSTIYSGFPSTTASSISTFATGVSNSEHGLFGYKIFDRSRQESVNLLSGIDKYSVLDYLKVEPISTETLCQVHAVTLPEYADSGFTRATMHNAQHHFADSISDRLEKAALVAEVDNSLVYVYVPELDQAAHRFGVASTEWLSLLSELDVQIQRSSSRLADGIGMLVTSDHGIVDVEKQNHIYLDDFAELNDAFLDVAGDPRVVFLYLQNRFQGERIRQILAERVASSAVACTPDQLISAGYWRESLMQDEDLLPDLIVLATADVAIYHRKFAKANSLKMIGQHGALSQEEISIPLIRLGAYSSSLLVP